MDINAGPSSCSLLTNQSLVSCKFEKGALLWRTARSCLARASLPISLASRISAAAPLFRCPLSGPLVSRKRRAARFDALVAHAPIFLLIATCNQKLDANNLGYLVA